MRLDTWELAFSNGGAIMDEIPVWSRDTHEQLAFQDQRNATNNPDNDVYNNGSLTTVSGVSHLSTLLIISNMFPFIKSTTLRKIVPP